MNGRRVVLGLLAALVVAVSLVVVPTTFGAPNSPDPKASGDHITYIFCHRTGSSSNPYIIIGTDDAAWAEAHMGEPTPTDPAHPAKDGRDDILIDFGYGLNQKNYTLDDCKKAGGKG